MSTFNVGDKVRIVRKVTSEDGWINGWASGMNRHVADGKVYTVREVSKSGVYFIENGFGWPTGALEMVKPKFGDKIKALARGTDITAGKIYTVVQYDDSDDMVRVRDDIGCTEWVSDWEIASFADHPVIKVGDKVRSLVQGFDVTKGKIYTVRSSDENDGSITIIDDVGDRWTLGIDEFEVVQEVADSEVTAPKFNVGDRVRVSTMAYGTDAARSGTGTVVSNSVEDHRGPIQVDLDEFTTPTYLESELTLLNDFGSAQVGDRVTVKDNGVGTVLAVDHDGWPGVKFDISTPGYHDLGGLCEYGHGYWCQPEDVTVIERPSAAANDNAPAPLSADTIAALAEAFVAFGETLKSTIQKAA